MARMKRKLEEEGLPAVAEEITTAAPAVTTTTEPEMKETALGVYKDLKTGEWKVALIAYDPVSGKAKMTRSVDTGGFRDMAIEKFKVEASYVLYKD